MATDARVKDVGGIEAKLLFDMVVDLNPPLDFGANLLGRRMLFGAARGSFEGPRLRGEVQAGGGDWALLRADGAILLDVRLTLRTQDGVLIYMTYVGRWITPADLRADLADPARRHELDPRRYYLRTTPLFETGARQYTWLNDIVCVGKGYLVEGGIAYKVFEVT